MLSSDSTSKKIICYSNSLLCCFKEWAKFREKMFSLEKMYYNKSTIIWNLFQWTNGPGRNTVNCAQNRVENDRKKFRIIPTALLYLKQGNPTENGVAKFKFFKFFWVSFFGFPQNSLKLKCERLKKSIFVWSFL